jgi:hypothetical protein
MLLLLIAARMAFGLLLIALSLLSAVVFYEAKTPHVFLGASVAAAATFACGLYFCNAALDVATWMPLFWIQREDDDAAK